MRGIALWHNLTRGSLTRCGQQGRLGGNLLPPRQDNPLASRLREALRGPRDISASRRFGCLEKTHRVAPSLGDWYLLSDDVTLTTSVMPSRGPINTQEPSLCALISTLMLRFALVALAPGCQTQGCNAKIGLVWGRKGSSRPDNPARALGSV